MERQKPSLFDRAKPRSLRLRLLLWYGTLLTVTLGLFVVLILVLTMNAINQSVDGDVQAEARVAMLNINAEMSSLPPYWPATLSLAAIDTYRDPGVVIEILDIQGNMRYRSAGGNATSILLSTTTIKAVLNNQTIWSTITTTGERVRMQALPIHAPQSQEASSKTGDFTGGKGQADEVTTGNGPVVGLLLVAKSLDDVDDTLLLLRTLLLLIGMVTLVGTLIASWLIATRVLHPLIEMAATARAIAVSTARGTRLGNLSQRVRQPRGDDEMAQVVDTFNEMLASLESATQVQRRFVADASHELRAPLTTIQGNLAFLQQHLDELPPQERRTMLTDAYSETLRLSGLVEELMLLARADANIDSSLQPSEEKSVPADRASLVELDHALLQLVRQLRRRLSVEGSTLNLDIGHIEPIRVRAEEENLRRVMLILLDNALKYTSSSEQADASHVTVSLEQMNGGAVLRVHDRGIGIEPDDLPHIFERFYRADRARSRQGTGLGLSIAQALVEQIGGHITAESVPGEGSTFSVWLPLDSSENLGWKR
jgi:two-component system, OmpR family, sensor kinase